MLLHSHVLHARLPRRRLRGCSKKCVCKKSSARARAWLRQRCILGQSMLDEIIYPWMVLESGLAVVLHVSGSSHTASYEISNKACTTRDPATSQGPSKLVRVLQTQMFQERLYHVLQQFPCDVCHGSNVWTLTLWIPLDCWFAVLLLGSDRCDLPRTYYVGRTSSSPDTSNKNNLDA